MKKLNVAMIGYGFMGKAHSNAYKRVNNFFNLEYEPILKVLCGRNEENAKNFAEQWGYESVETDWKKVIKRDDVDAVDICTPNNFHAEIAIAAAEAGKTQVVSPFVILLTLRADFMNQALSHRSFADALLP